RIMTTRSLGFCLSEAGANRIQAMKWKLRQRLALILAILFPFVAAICHAQSGWTNKRIGSGGKDLNAVYFIDARHGWVGGDGGFLSHTEDGGASWTERPIGRSEERRVGKEGRKRW